MEAEGESVPTPLAEQKFSGKFQIRMPEDSHRRLATEAAEMGVSLNRLVNARLAHR